MLPKRIRDFRIDVVGVLVMLPFLAVPFIDAGPLLRSLTHQIIIGLTAALAVYIMLRMRLLSFTVPAFMAIGGYTAAILATSGTTNLLVLLLAAFIVPFMFVYSPSLLMIGEWIDVVHSAITAATGCLLLAAGLHGYLIARATWLERGLMVAAAITLMRTDLRLVPAALDIARRTRRTIAHNLGWAFVYNVIGIPLAAFGVLSPAFAGAAMAFSSVSVVTNSALLARWKPSGAAGR